MKAKLTYNGKEIEVEIAQKELEKLEVVNGVWVPVIGDYYYTFNGKEQTWDDDSLDNEALAIGDVHPTKEAAQKAYDLEVARTKIRRSSSFRPDWSNHDQYKWSIYYNHIAEKLLVGPAQWTQGINTVYYETKPQAEQAAKDLKAEYLLVAGVES